MSQISDLLFRIFNGGKKRDVDRNILTLTPIVQVQLLLGDDLKLPCINFLYNCRSTCTSRIQKIKKKKSKKTNKQTVKNMIKWWVGWNCWPTFQNSSYIQRAKKGAVVWNLWNKFLCNCRSTCAKKWTKTTLEGVLISIWYFILRSKVCQLGVRG